MQNKANFKKAQMNVSSILTKDYENKYLGVLPEKQSQTKPISLPPKSGKVCTGHGGNHSNTSVGVTPKSSLVLLYYREIPCII